MNVLIADRAPQIRKGLKNLLAETEGINSIEEAADKQELFTKLAAGTDLLILDMHFGDISGFEVLRYMQGMPVKPLTVLLSDYSFSQYKDKSGFFGADYFLGKADEFSRIPDIIEDHSRKKAVHAD